MAKYIFFTTPLTSAVLRPSPARKLRRRATTATGEKLRRHATTAAGEEPPPSACKRDGSFAACPTTVAGIADSLSSPTACSALNKLG
jgi:hypothetical protein